MTPSTFALEDAIKAIAEDGFYHMQDPTVGQRISEMEENKHQFSTTSTAGLEFYRDNVHGDQRIRSILEDFFPWCALGDYRRIQEDRGHIFQLMRGGSKADVIVVQLWKGECRGVYWRGSHMVARETLGSVRSANLMWEVASAKLERAGCEPIPLDFQTSGFVILDARTAFETDHGSPVTCSFAPLYHLKSWQKLSPPKTKGSENLVKELQSDRVGVYFATQDNH
ncbi:hypothetical protein J3459_016953 [Metarhizium acridum]|nr:hypothetical protein J3459_016953 [Metarhizium acridum]